jgi:hypothetical protein
MEEPTWACPTHDASYTLADGNDAEGYDVNFACGCELLAKPTQVKIAELGELPRLRRENEELRKAKAAQDKMIEVLQSRSDYVVTDDADHLATKRELTSTRNELRRIERMLEKSRLDHDWKDEHIKMLTSMIPPGTKARSEKVDEPKPDLKVTIELLLGALRVVLGRLK